MSSFSVHDTPLVGLRCIERQVRADARGFLSRVFCSQSLQSWGWQGQIAQINHTFTMQRGTVRGCHYQLPPHAEIKLVSCLQGEVWDVAIDLRAGSPTFLRWHAEHLSAANKKAMLIPQGFAHGFQTLCDDVEMLYCHSAPYAPDAEAGLNPLDPGLDIAWPLPVQHLSPRDAEFAMVDAHFQGVLL